VKLEGAEASQEGELKGEAVELAANRLVLLLPCSQPAGAPIEVSVHPFSGGNIQLLGRVHRCRRVLTGTYEVNVKLTP
jgi:hypothetical protein